MIKAGDIIEYGTETNDDIFDELLLNNDIRKFVQLHDLKHTDLEKGVIKLLRYSEETKRCANCKGLALCLASGGGYVPSLDYSDNEINLVYEKCDLNKNEFNKVNKKINCMYMPKNVLTYSLEDMSLLGSDRKEIHKYISRFLAFNSKDDPMKGMYLSGIYHSGKTYILGALANELGNKGYEVIMAYYPDLSRELKSSIDKGEIEEKIITLKTVDVLILDDIGGESLNQYIRDEVLGPILQYRVLEKLPTFFSSNFTMARLCEALRKDGSDQEKIKALRIYERIKSLAVEIQLDTKYND